MFSVVTAQKRPADKLGRSWPTCAYSASDRSHLDAQRDSGWPRDCPAIAREKWEETVGLQTCPGQCLAANFCFILSAFLWGIARPLGCQVQKLPTGTSGKKSRHLHIGRDTLEKSSLQCNVSLWIQHLAGCFLSKNLHRTGKGCSKHLGFLDSNYFELRGSHWAMPCHANMWVNSFS